MDRYFAFPFCTSAGVAIVTGRLLLRFGMTGPIFAHGGLPIEEAIAGEVFREAGHQV